MAFRPLLRTSSPDRHGGRNQRHVRRGGRSSVMATHDRVEMNPKIMPGKPEIRGSRIAIACGKGQGEGERSEIAAFLVKQPRPDRGAPTCCARDFPG
jgi:hypothetical protein